MAKQKWKVYLRSGNRNHYWECFSESQATDRDLFMVVHMFKMALSEQGHGSLVRVVKHGVGKKWVLEVQAGKGLEVVTGWARVL